MSLCIRRPSENSRYDDNPSNGPLAATQKAAGTATLSSCILNLGNTIVGAGMLGLPGAFVGTGWLGGILLLVVGATLSSHGLILLAKSATLSGLPSSFYTVAHAAVPQYTVLIDAAVALKCTVFRYSIILNYMVQASSLFFCSHFF